MPDRAVPRQTPRGPSANYFFHPSFHRTPKLTRFHGAVASTRTEISSTARERLPYSSFEIFATSCALLCGALQLNASGHSKTPPAIVSVPSCQVSLSTKTSQGSPQHYFLLAIRLASCSSRVFAALRSARDRNRNAVSGVRRCRHTQTLRALSSNITK